MENISKKIFLRIIFFLCLLGLYMSLLLTKNHYVPPSEGTFCDLGTHVSCSLVNTSIYSELLNIPVAVLGGIWFLLLLLMTWKSAKRDETLPKLMYWWSIFGFLFIIYMIVAEVILKAVCPLCTVVHVAVAVILYSSLKIYRRQETLPSKEEFLTAVKRWGAVIIILNLAALFYFNLIPTEEIDYDSFVQCLNENGAIMYGSEQCGICLRQKAMFGKAASKVAIVECAPDQPYSQWQLCVDKGIEGTPTWTLEPEGLEIKRHVGFMSVEDLAEFAGCEEAILH